jgi:RNA polymerase sigma-70 factor (ECF subfamily)
MSRAQEGATFGAEARWLAALRDGEAEAFDRLYEDYADRLFGYVLRRVGHYQDAEEVTAEVFLAAFQSARKFRNTAGLYPWLLGIARRKVADHLRRRQRRPEIPESDWACSDEGVAHPFAGMIDTAPLPQEVVEREEMRALVRCLVEQLPEAQREALLLRVVEELSIKDIGRLLRRSEDAVQGLIRRAKATLSAQMRDYFTPPGSQEKEP